MKDMKRFAAILLAAVLSCGSVATASAAVETNAAPWAVPVMEYAYTAGLLTTAELQEARSPMSRQNFCGLVIRFLETATGREWNATAASPFSDCQDADVVAAYEAGIIGGVEEGVFAPERTLTREQMAIITARMLRVCGVDLTETARENPFTDTAALYASSNQYIDQLYGAGIISGYDNGTFGPFRELTVQEAVASFVQAYRYLQEHGAAEQETEQETKPQTEQETETQTEQETETQTEQQTEQETETQTEQETEQETQTEQQTEATAAETVSIAGKTVSLGMTAAELQAVWGAPDRVDETVYSVERYIYLNDYETYFFATMQDGCVVEIFVPGTYFSYLGMDGTGDTSDISTLDYISAAEHSAVIRHDAAEARLPLDYEGNIVGLLLQTTTFLTEKDPMSVLHRSVQEDLEAELADIIQVRRKADGEALLEIDPKISAVARAHSADMVTEHYFDYNSPDGTTPFGRLMEENISFLTASEVIARKRGDVVNIYQEWVRTAAKYTGLTDGTMQRMGVGVDTRTKELYVTVDLCG